MRHSSRQTGQQFIAQTIAQTIATREQKTELANGDGDFTVALLLPGRYSVAAESAGFRPSLFLRVNVNVDQTVCLGFTLQVGSATEEVNVVETLPIVQRDNSTMGQVVNNRLVRNVPLN